MKTTHFPAAHFKTNVWSGGTTTELFIFPPTANYAARNFDFRISTATVNVAVSEFTALPDISRKLMVLDGATKLTHENQHTKTLRKFDVDEFEGDWKTTSSGQCTDFNLMTRDPISGEIWAKSFEKDTSAELQMQPKSRWFLVYVFVGEAKIFIADENVTVKEGDFFTIENPTKSELKICAKANCELIFTAI